MYLLIGQAREDYENVAEQKVYNIINAKDGEVKHCNKTRGYGER